jgi:hypothetical protein
MAPSCSLDETGARAQLERYRRVGRDAQLVTRSRRTLVVDLDRGVDTRLLEEAIAIERDCCPFFSFEWEPDRPRLTVAVARTEEEPALDAIAFALGVEQTQRAASG